MPTYEYACRACGHVFDIVQKMSDDRLTICPECGGELRKVFAPPAIAFKGSGFYATDHGKKSNASSDTAEGDHKKKEEGTKEGAKESGAAKEGGTKEPGASGTTSSTPAEDGGSAS